MSQRFRLQGATAVCLLSLVVPPAPAAHAQTAPAAAQTKKPAAATTSKTRSAAGAADPLAAERRANAIALINALADESRGFRDQTLRARVQAQAADALWETDRERARALFRRAWDAAEAADAENARRGEEQNRASGRSGTRGLNIPNLRGEVLRGAARRERALGEEFLGKMEEARKREAGELNNASANLPTGAQASSAGTAAGGGKPAPPVRRDPEQVSPDVARRLRLAMQFLEDGDTERALQFAEPVLGSVNPSSVEFLVLLRERSQQEADRRYTALLSSVAASPNSDAGDILLLSSYVLTPHLYMTIGQGGQGISSSQRRGDISTPDLPGALRVAFAQAAAQVLLRPLPQEDQDATATGRVGTFFVISRLMPFFEAVIPDGVPALRARLAALNPDIPERARDNLSEDLTRGLIPKSAQGDAVQESLERAGRATDPRERDMAYLRASQAAAEKGDARARDFAEKIEDAELRRQTRAFIDFALVNRAIREQKDGLEVLRLLAVSGELTPVQRAWAYTEAARLLVKDDRARALESLEAAASAAKAIDAADPDRVRSTVGVATRFFDFDRNRAWEIMGEAVKAANAAPEFTGADAGLSSRIRSEGMSMTMNFSAPVFDLTGVFQTLAKDDMNRAIALAQTFTNESPRAVATLAIARAVLDADKERVNRR
ncbi:MAG TPA: hypothetical protein VEY11_01295 [Pyrinomonadaceae bacterium]|nr:hypothetical protein [Pyrinomonadaceae bacterium]